MAADREAKPRGPAVPICVNIQNITEAKIYRDAGINVYMAIDDIVESPADPRQFKATAETLNKLSELGMYAFVFQDKWGHLKDHPAIIGWLSPVDEPDNVQSGGKAMPLDEYLAASKKIKDFDATKPYTVCFGQGVINDLFKGRGIPRDMYPKYMEIVDFIQYDVYPITNSKREDGENYLDLTGQGVSRIRKWTGDKKPVMCWIETTRIKHPTKSPTPAQTNCEVWTTMVHGARGVGYFCHDFTLESRRASALSRDKAMLAQLKKTNAKLMKLAKVVNSPLAAEPVTAKSTGGKVIASTKRVMRFSVKSTEEGAVSGKAVAALAATKVILAVNVLGEKAEATITMPGLKKGMIVNVLEEGRTIAADRDGAFVDEFAPYQEHIYETNAAP